MNEKEMQNLYEVRKTVRFELIPQFIWTDKNQPKSSDLKKDLKDFIEIYENLLSNFNQIVFNFNKETLNKNLKIKFSFLKTYTKREYYELKIESLKKWNNQILIWNNKKLDYLLEIFKSFEKNNILYLEQIKSLWLRNEENKSRNADLAYYFHQISVKTNFEFIKELFNENIWVENNINISNKIKETKDITKEIENLILSIEKTLLPTSSMWQVIEKASFNYYTVNKKPKDYEIEIKEKENDVNKWLFEFTYFDKKEKKKKEIFDSKLLDNWFIKFLDTIDDEKFSFRKFWDIAKKEKKYLSLKIEQAYNLMKEYKAQQKSNFLEYLNEEARWNKSNLDISLFNDILNKSEYEKILNLTKAILLLSQVKTDVINLKETINKEEKEDEITESLEKYNTQFWNIFWKVERSNFFEKIKDLKDKRSQYFFEWNKSKFTFTKYWNFCNEYKKVAVQYGKIKALIKALEKEKVDSDKTDSWALILENQNNKFLLTIPRTTNKNLNFWETNLNKAKNHIDNLKDEQNWNWNLCKFESLTLRALDKLCFWKEINKNKYWEQKEEDNEFRKNIFQEISKYTHFLNWKQKLKDKFDFKIEKKKLENWKEIVEKIDDEKLILDFYQTVLKLESTQKQIIIEHFKDFKSFIDWEYSSLDKFEQELKKVCYIKEKIVISEETKGKIIKDFKANFYKITSYDLAKNDEEILKNLKYKIHLERKSPKKHTELWWNFWTQSNEENKYHIRLNPEIKISFLEKTVDFIKSNSWITFNRKFHDRYLLTTTITQNALEKSLDLNFKEKDEIITTYNNYNSEFNKNLKSNWLQYFYWLDRWENELISLWLFDLSKEKNEEKWVKIEVYELKDDFLDETDEKWKVAYKNISYFTDEKYNDFFEKKDVSCMALSCAKVIKWKIYINWDISTYLNLKMASAKRKIYEIISKSLHKTEKLTFDEYNTKIYIDWYKNEYIYKFNDTYQKIISFAQVKEELSKYINKVKLDLNDNDEISIEKVNHLRDALCANMVWIITFLQEKYFWMIFFEDKNIAGKIWDFEKSNTSLWSRIEQKLLQKFVSLNFVPPTYKQILWLQSEKIIYQLWIIWYVSIDSTSKNCPMCPWKLFWHWSYENENSMHHQEEWKYIAKEMRSWKTCDYHMNNNHYWFSFIHSWDDLATYNIAKKWCEYIKTLN